MIFDNIKHGKQSKCLSVIGDRCTKLQGLESIDLMTSFKGLNFSKWKKKVKLKCLKPLFQGCAQKMLLDSENGI